LWHLIDVAEATGTHAGSLYRMLRAQAVASSVRERTEAEYRDLLQQAGLELITITPTASPFSIIEAASA
jgi:hypothetical protein